MKIEAEFEPGQKVWFIRDNKCTNLPVYEFHVWVIGEYPPRIYYNFQTEDGCVSVYEDKVFATKEELINSL